MGRTPSDLENEDTQSTINSLEVYNKGGIRERGREHREVNIYII